MQEILRVVPLNAPAAIDLKREGMFLTRIQLRAGVNSAYLKWKLDNAHNAHFGVNSDGVHGYEEYELNEPIPVKVIPADWFSFHEGLAEAVFTFSSMPNAAGKRIGDHRNIVFYRNAGAAENPGVAVEVEFPGGGAMPKGVVGCINAQSGRADFPRNGMHDAFLHAAVRGTRMPRVTKVQPYASPMDSLALTIATVGGAAKSMYLVYY